MAGGMIPPAIVRADHRWRRPGSGPALSAL